MKPTTLTKPSQHCSDAITDQKSILKQLKETPAYFPSAVAEKETAVDFTKETIRRLRESVKFHIPYGGNIMIDMIEGLSFKDSLNKFLPQYRLPFPLLALEFDFIVNANVSSNFVENNLPYKATIILIHEELREDNNPLLIVRLVNKVLSTFSNKYEWHCLPYDVVIDFETCRSDDRFSKIVGIRPINEKFMNEYNSDDFHNDVKDEIGIILQFLIAMSCRNVGANVEAPPSMTDNKKRQKKGLEKHYQYRNIVINTKLGVQEVGKSPKSHGGGTVIPHIRRGHIRHYDNKNIWIEQTVVNADKGVAPSAKNYTIK